MGRTPRKPTKRESTYEHFHFAVESWAFTQSIFVNTDRTGRRNLGPVTAYREVKLEGPLISRTKRAIQRAEMLVWPDGPDPSDWPDEVDAVGAVIHIVEGKMTVIHRVTVAAFQAVLTTAGAGRLVEFSATVTDLRAGRGRVIAACIQTERTDPDDLLY